MQIFFVKLGERVLVNFTTREEVYWTSLILHFDVLVITY